MDRAEYVVADYDGSRVRVRLVTGMMFSPRMVERTPSCPTVSLMSTCCVSRPTSLEPVANCYELQLGLSPPQDV